MSRWLLNIRYYIRLWIPFQIRDGWILSFMESLLRPLVDLTRDFHDEMAVHEVEIRRLNQQVVIENYLNDLFDPPNRGIELITNNDPVYPVILFSDTEVAAGPVISGDGSESIILFSDSGTVDLWNYEIRIPSSLGLTAPQLEALTLIIEKYKQVGRVYKFTFI